MLNRQPIKQETIEGMINRHARSYFKIGELYCVNTRNWKVPNETKIVPLLDYTIGIDYKAYCDICAYNKSIPHSKLAFYPGTRELVRGCSLKFCYSYLLDNKITSNEVHTMLRDPIYSHQTMNSKIAIFATDCIKAVKKYEDE